MRKPKFRFPKERVPDGDILAPHHFYVGVALAVFGFMFVWPYYSAVGAAMSILGVAIMLDDLVSHAFGIWTPLDAVWKRARRSVSWLRR